MKLKIGRVVFFPVVLTILVGITFNYQNMTSLAQGNRPPQEVPFCDTHPNGEYVERSERDFEFRKAERARIGAGADLTAGLIPVYFHVINRGRSKEAGNLSDAQIRRQINHLNTTFSATGWTFTLAGIDRTRNETWFNECAAFGEAEVAMKSSLRQGSADDLNIYSCLPNNGLLGRASFPFDYQYSPIIDGIVINYLTLPGGTIPDYSEGDLTTHETGHWMGLLHTFQFGCEGDKTTGGDLVADTPAEGSAASGCPVGRDTCPGKRGLDPIDNFMDYSSNACTVRFTPNQDKRMDEQFTLYRAGK